MKSTDFLSKMDSPELFMSSNYPSTYVILLTCTHTYCNPGAILGIQNYSYIHNKVGQNLGMIIFCDQLIINMYMIQALVFARANFGMSIYYIMSICMYLCTC